MKIIFCAWGHVGLGNIIKFITYFEDYELFVYTYDRENNRELVDFLENHGIMYSFKNINDCEVEVKKFNPDYIVSAFYRHIISENVLKFAKNTMNVHPTLLPKYKGRYIGFWIIFNCDEETGITYHRMTTDVDSGGVYLQKKIKIHETDTAYSIYVKSTALAVECFIEAFNKMLTGVETFDQVGESSSFLKKEFPFNGRISANNSVKDLSQFSKAVYFPGKNGAIIYDDNKEFMVKGQPTIRKIKNILKKIKGVQNK